jgi:hypothetical protein
MVDTIISPPNKFKRQIKSRGNGYCAVDVSLFIHHIIAKSDWKSPVGAGSLAMPEALRIFTETLSTTQPCVSSSVAIPFSSEEDMLVSSPEGFESLVKAGIYTPDGKLAPRYGG